MNTQSGLKFDAGKIRMAELLFDFPALLRNAPAPYDRALLALARAARGEGDERELRHCAGLIAGDAIFQIVAAVGAFGLAKYGTLGGWMTVENRMIRYANAGARHAAAAIAGERLDDQSRLPHDYHLTWNLCAVAEIIHKTPES